MQTKEIRKDVAPKKIGENKGFFRFIALIATNCTFDNIGTLILFTNFRLFRFVIIKNCEIYNVDRLVNPNGFVLFLFINNKSDKLLRRFGLYFSF